MDDDGCSVILAGWEVYITYALWLTAWLRILEFWRYGKVKMFQKVKCCMKYGNTCLTKFWWQKFRDVTQSNLFLNNLFWIRKLVAYKIRIHFYFFDCNITFVLTCSEISAHDPEVIDHFVPFHWQRDHPELNCICIQVITEDLNSVAQENDTFWEKYCIGFVSKIVSHISIHWIN